MPTKWKIGGPGRTRTFDQWIMRPGWRVLKPTEIALGRRFRSVPVPSSLPLASSKYALIYEFALVVQIYSCKLLLALTSYFT